MMSFLSKFFGPASPEKFAEIVRRELQRQGESNLLRFDAASFSFAAESESGRETIFLGNAYSKYCSAPRGERRELVEWFVASTLERRTVTPPESFEEARSLLMPTARSLSYFSCTSLQVRLHLAGDGSILPSAELPGGIGIGLVLDFPNTVRYVPNETLRKWGISFEEGLEVAKENLRARSRERIPKVHECLSVLPWHDTYDAARLLLPELFTRLDLDGDPVALAVHRDLVLVTGSEDIAGLALMAVNALEAVQEPYPVSPYPLVLRGFEWSPFVVEKFPAPFKKLALTAIAGEYADQRELLEALAARDNEGVFVANFLPTEHRETKTLSSWVTWSNSGVQLIPEAEMIQFVELDSGDRVTRSETASWQCAVDILGARMQKVPNLYPPRWRVDGFPSDEEFRAMSEGASIGVTL